MKRINRYLILNLSLIILCSNCSQVVANNKIASNFLPDSLLQLDNTFAHHILIAEKATHQLYLYQNNNSNPLLVKKYQIATGKKAGNKIFQGDHRTPEGIYQIINFIPHQELIKNLGKAGEMYGAGAFVMNYPNPIDQLQNKTGGGIWLHSTDDETRIDKGLDSRGCFVTANDDLKEISQYIELNKTALISVSKSFLPYKRKLAGTARNTWESC